MPLRYSLHHQKPELRGDREIAEIAVRKNASLIQFVSEELRANRDLVLIAVRLKGDVIKFASEELRGDREIVLIAVRESVLALQHVSEAFRNDPQIVSECLLYHWTGTYYVKIGSQLRHRVGCVLQSLEAKQSIRFVDKESAIEFCTQWERSVWHKIWLIGQLVDSGVDSYCRRIVELDSCPYEQLFHSYCRAIKECMLK
jgi:hypothetical protein